MRERFWLTVELLLRKFNVGKEPAEAHNFARREQLWYGACVWVGRQEWMSPRIRTVAQLQSMAMAAMMWPRPYPIGAVTAGEAEKLALVLGTHSEAYERFGMRSLTLADIGKKRPQPHFSRYYEEPVHLPSQTWWVRLSGGVVNAIVQWVCRRK